METYICERPSALPAAPAPMSAVRVIPTADIPRRPWAYQVQSQLVQALVNNGSEETTRFTGKDIPTGEKQVDVRGVPPRGRPV